MGATPVAVAAPTPDVAIDILVDDPRWEGLAGVSAHVEGAARAALATCADTFDGPVEMAITLSTDAGIQVLNREWRGKDKPTNVLSFPAAEVPEGVTPEPLGDVIIALETVQREAAEEGKRVQDHLVHLVVHGTLHLLGFDHEDDAEAEEMEEMERSILARLGISDPYAMPAET
ncbi:MAG: rRNA maturation RNase YbeY [Azorhizobium sp. 12-66-6]|nr:MAG: rRNA maturation RNase YbeY [Azorhizobium sp. 12-66-6]